jgi:hypothetical protein
VTRLAGADDQEVGAVCLGLPGDRIVFAAPAGTDAQREVGADLRVNVGAQVAGQDLDDLAVRLERLRRLEPQARVLAGWCVEVDQVDIARRAVEGPRSQASAASLAGEKSIPTTTLSGLPGLASVSFPTGAAGTTTIGQGVLRMVCSATLPRKKCAAPLRPWVPTTTRLAPTEWAWRAMSEGAPYSTVVLTVMPAARRASAWTASELSADPRSSAIES